MARFSRTYGRTKHKLQVEGANQADAHPDNLETTCYKSESGTKRIRNLQAPNRHKAAGAGAE